MPALPLGALTAALRPLDMTTIAADYDVPYRYHPYQPSRHMRITRGAALVQDLMGGGRGADEDTGEAADEALPPIKAKVAWEISGGQGPCE